MTTHPAHLYRALLRECTYLPLPQCRSFIKQHVTDSFRRWLPKYKNKPGKTNTGREIDFPRQVRLLHRGRKFHSTLARANDGHLGPLETVLRMTYGRTGPRRYQLLDRFTHPTVSSDELSKDAQGLIEPYSKAWDPPPRLQALLASQAVQQRHFERVGGNRKISLRFKPPATTTRGQPLPERRYKSLKHDWYNQNIKAVFPPLPGPEYKELYNLVTGATRMPEPVPRRARALIARADEEQHAVAEQSSLILTGPRPGNRAKDFRNGRPHTISPRLLRHLLSRAVLKQTPLVKMDERAKTDSGLVFLWDDGLSRSRLQNEKLTTSMTDEQSNLLFS